MFACSHVRMFAFEKEDDSSIDYGGWMFLRPPGISWDVVYFGR